MIPPYKHDASDNQGIIRIFLKFSFAIEALNFSKYFSQLLLYLFI